MVGGCEGEAVDFAVGGEGEAFPEAVFAGDHVGGEEGGEVVFENGRGGVALDMGDEAVIAGKDDGFADLGVAGESDFDFAELDAEAIDFHLVIGPAAEFVEAAGEAAGEVAGAVEGS